MPRRSRRRALRSSYEALACSDANADFIARPFIERLHYPRRRQPRGLQPVPHSVLTDATDRT